MRSSDMQPVPAAVRNWLIVIAAMIFFMIVLGALTRLTESGEAVCPDKDGDTFVDCACGGTDAGAPQKIRAAGRRRCSPAGGKPR